jgi:hypothetical protein
MQALIYRQIKVSFAFASIDNAVKNKLGAAKPDVIG